MLSYLRIALEMFTSNSVVVHESNARFPQAHQAPILVSRKNVPTIPEAIIRWQNLMNTSLLHAGLAAKALRRDDIIQDLVVELDNALSWPLQRKEPFGGEALLVKARERLRKEVEF